MESFPVSMLDGNYRGQDQALKPVADAISAVRNRQRVSVNYLNHIEEVINDNNEHLASR